METDENEYVLLFCCFSVISLILGSFQGIKGEYKIFGSTPELDDFYIRVVDGTCSVSFFFPINLSSMQAQIIRQLEKVPIQRILKHELERAITLACLCHPEQCGKQEVCYE